MNTLLNLAYLLMVFCALLLGMAGYFTFRMITGDKKIALISIVTVMTIALVSGIGGASLLEWAYTRENSETLCKWIGGALFAAGLLIPTFMGAITAVAQKIRMRRETKCKS